MRGAQVRCSAPTHSAASSVDGTGSRTVVVLSTDVADRLTRWARTPSRISARATRTAPRPGTAMKSDTESSETLWPAQIPLEAGIAVARTSSGPKGTHQSGERHRSAVQTEGRSSSARSTT